MMSSFYVRLNGKVMGPLETLKIRQLLERGKCNGETPVSTDRSRWVPLRDVEELRALPGGDVVLLRSQQKPPEAAKKAPLEPPPLIPLSCPACSHQFSLEKDKCETVVLCPACGKSFAPSAPAPGEGAVPPPVPSPAVRPGYARRNLLLLLGAAVAAAVLLATSGGLWWYLARSGGDFTSTVKRYEPAVGVVVVVYSARKTGKKLSNPIGTTFAIAPNRFATNAHVALAIKTALPDAMKAWKLQAGDIAIDSVEIRLSKSHGKAFPVTHVQIHKRYNDVSNSNNPDVAVLTVEGKTDVWFPRAPRRTLESLAAGMQVASLGFPMEGLAHGNINVSEPVATYAQGEIKSLTDFEEKDAGPEGNVSIKHSIPATGGASGSPIFLPNGQVIGILWGVSFMGLDSEGNRQASGAMHNFGVRIDLLDGIGEPVVLDNFIIKP